MLRRLIFMAAMVSAAASAHAVPTASVKAISLGVAADFKLAQSYGQDIIPPSAAARIALKIAPSSKLLNVRLSGGGSPRYVIKTRNKGKLRIIEIDAKTGSVVRR